MVEAHGTGTKLGDPIEYEALTRAFRHYTDQKEYCALGSIKTNLGHSTAAAGITGLIKVLLSLQHRKIPASLHYETGNHHIQFQDSPFYVNCSLKNWEPGINRKRVAALSAFGFSGTNAHMVIEEAPVSERKHSPKTGYLVALSARTAAQLRQQVEQLADFLENEPEVDLGDLSYTLLLGRKHFNHRLAGVVRSRTELTAFFRKWLEKGKVSLIYVSELNEKDHREQSSLKQYGNQCIHNCQNRTGDYLEQLATITELYIQGYDLDFDQLYTDEMYTRISLPTYPFAKERYWLPESDRISEIDTQTVIPKAVTSIAAVATTETRPIHRARCFLTKQWELCPAAPTKQFHRIIAILATPATRELANQLSRHFPKSRILNDDDLKVHLQQPGHEWRNYDGMVDLAGCGAGKLESLDWLAWLQQLIDQGHKEGLMLLGVTKQLESYQNTTINLSGASRAGLYRMLQSEYSHLRSRHLDMDVADDDLSAQQIAAEFLNNREDPEVCYRNGIRYRAVFRELPVAGAVAPTLKFPEDQVLWITGGTRGLGILCAQHLVKNYGVKRLVLTGREVIPAKERWDDYQNQNNSLAQKIRAIQSLEAHGVQVQVYSVALTDEPAIKQCLQTVKNTMGPVGGFIHCAGNVDIQNPAFIRKPLAGIQQVLDPKIAGLDIIYQNFKTEPLQFFILFSSVAAVIPTLAAGEADYAMANAYMDYLAEAVNAEALNLTTDAPIGPMVSIQWPAWKETGMGDVKSRAYGRTRSIKHYKG